MFGTSNLGFIRGGSLGQRAAVMEPPTDGLSSRGKNVQAQLRDQKPSLHNLACRRERYNAQEIIPFRYSSAGYSFERFPLEKKKQWAHNKDDGGARRLGTDYSYLHWQAEDCQNVNPPSIHFEVYGERNGAISKPRPTERASSRGTQRGGKSRVWAAWKELQSWGHLKLGSTAAVGTPVHDEEDRDFVKEITPVSLTIRFDNIRKVNENQESLRKGSRSQEEQTVKKWDADALLASSNRGFSEVSNDKNMCKRQTAISAIAQALTPSLHSNREGQGELALRMAEFLSALKSSVKTNEVDCCERKVAASLASMTRGTELAEIDSKLINIWLDAVEEQLRAVPTEADVRHLEALLDDLEWNPGKGRTPCTSTSCHQKSQRCCCRGPQEINLPSYTIGSKESELDQIAHTTTNLEINLANMPTVTDIQKMRCRGDKSAREMTCHCKDTREAVDELHLAIGSGEVAWFKSLDISTARLEAIAHVVLPLEAIYISPPATT